MKSLLKLSSAFIIFTFILASDSKEESKKSELSNGNSYPEKQLLVSEVLPIDIEKITKTRNAKSINDQKYAQKILRQHMADDSNLEKNDLSARKIDKKNVLKKWSADLRSKLSVVKFKGKSGEKNINLPSIPESN